MDRRRHHPPVPKTTAVIPGAAVNIVLKADQPTGRTVSGVVRDVLTRGDHPRGIKVRLSDGRIGRVQSMSTGASSSSASSSTAAAGQSSGSSGGGPDGDGEGGLLWQGTHDGGDALSGRGAYDGDHLGARRGGRSRRAGGRGGRGGGGGAAGLRGLDEEQGLPPQEIGLDAYVKEARPKQRRGRGNRSLAAEQEQQDQSPPLPPPSETFTCPVCGAFEGDEDAVSYHVATHFDSASP